MRYLVLITLLFIFDASPDGKTIFNKNFAGVVIILCENGLGSGAIINESGYVLTNSHVLQGSKEVEVLLYGADSLDEAKHIATVVKDSPIKDLALLKIIDPKHKLDVINISIVEPQPGDEAHAIGHPNGEIWSYTKGYVSQVRYDYTWQYSKNNKMFATVLQIQTPINPGSSGGPLLNNHGNLIGINSFAASDLQTMNFAISVEEIIKFLGGKS
tara:strand:+ start:241 stop:882 length:642 start_codon:yes stop_codon:yes gene_type:complete